MSDRETGPLRLRVVIPTHRLPSTFARTLATVAAQIDGAEDAAAVVVGSGVDGGRFAEVEAEAGRHGMDALHVPVPGSTRARNAGLEWARDADVVAFIDDDAIPAADWLSALGEHWRRVPEEVGCIAGAVDPLWLQPPPEWMSDRLRVVFSLLDRGPGVLPLRPGVEDAFGANFSFRAEALRAVGGFSTSLGPVGRIPFFGEETDVLRRLDDAGWSGIYAGDVRVEHAISPERMTLREVTRRRFYSGAGMRTLGLWSLRDGLARLLAGAGEALIAIPRRSSSTLAAGLARAGAGAGVLAAPIVRARLRRERGG